jgi:hypothetical protein
MRQQREQAEDYPKSEKIAPARGARSARHGLQGFLHPFPLAYFARAELLREYFKQQDAIVGQLQPC